MISSMTGFGRGSAQVDAITATVEMRTTASKDEIKATQEEEGLSEDMRYLAEDKLQTLTNEYGERVDKILDRKQKAIMEV